MLVVMLYSFLFVTSLTAIDIIKIDFFVKDVLYLFVVWFLLMNRNEGIKGIPNSC